MTGTANNCNDYNCRDKPVAQTCLSIAPERGGLIVEQIPTVAKDIFVLIVGPWRRLEITLLTYLLTGKLWENWIYTVSQKKLGHFSTAYNFRNIEEIFAILGINHVLFMLNIMP